MGVIDRAKRLKAKAEKRLLPQRFVFHHVPKCGGTSVGRALRKRYLLSQATVKPEESFRAFEAFSGRSDREQMLVDVLDLREQMLLYHMFDDVRGISAHVRFSRVAHELFAESYKFVTILREPVARFVSHFNWSHAKPEAHARIDEDFDAFLQTERARRLGATYVEFYSALPSHADMCSDTAIAVAQDNLRHFQVIGNLADTNGFQDAIRRELGVKIAIRHENKAASARRFVTLRELSDSQRAQVEALCAPDTAVWQYAQKLSDPTSTTQSEARDR